MHSYGGQDAAFCINPTPSAGQSHGKSAIAWCIGTQGLESIYSAAASIVVLLIWVYYSAQIVLFGAEMTHATCAPPPRSLPRGACALAARPLFSAATLISDSASLVSSRRFLPRGVASSRPAASGISIFSAHATSVPCARSRNAHRRGRYRPGCAGAALPATAAAVSCVPLWSPSLR